MIRTIRAGIAERFSEVQSFYIWKGYANEIDGFPEKLSMTNQANFQYPAFPIWQGFLLAAISGILMVFSWPNGFVSGFSAWAGWLAFVSLTPYIIVWQRSGWRGAFIYAWVMGFIYFMGMLSWIRLIDKDTNVGNAIAWIFFSFCGAVYFGLFGATARAVKNRLGWPEALILSLSWTAWEYLRGHILMGGWPWGSLGHTQYANWLMRQIAGVAGVGGISFLIVFLNVCLAKVIRGTWKINFFLSFCSWGEALRGKFRKHPVWGIVAGSMLLLWLCLGVIGVVEMIGFSRIPKKDRLDLALVQANINTVQVWDDDYKIKAFDRMRPLHLAAAARKPDLIVWAESCFPGILEYEQEYEWNQELRSLIKEGGIPTVLTSNEYVYEKSSEGPAEETRHHYNSVFLLGEQGETLGRYRKIRLVPFGEYIPWPILDRFLDAVVEEPLPIDFEPGSEYKPLLLGPHCFSPLVCYENLFEELGSQMARQGADFFLAMSNDGWSGMSAMSFQHTAMAVFLAVEHRAYIAIANMTGPTCVIDPWGNMSEHLKYFTKGIKFERIYPVEFKTFFTRHGNLIPFLFLLLFFTLFLSLFFPRRK